MTKNVTSDEVSVNRFVKCPHPLLFDKSLSGAALKLFLVIEHHRFGEKSHSFPSQARLSELTGYSKRYIRDLIIELELKNHLTVERASGKVSRYGPRNYNVTVYPDPGTITSRTPEPGRHAPRNYNVNEEDVLNKIKEQDFTQQLKRHSRKEKSPPPKDPVVIQQLLDQIDLSKKRDKWASKIDFDDVWENFTEAALEGTAKKPEPNPYDYRDFSKGLDGWCKRRLKEAKNQPITKIETSDYPKLNVRQC